MTAELPSGRGLHADLLMHRGALTLAVEFDLAPGEVLGVVGRNGAGKSSLLAALTGRAAIDGGHITLGENVLSEAREGQSPVGVRPAARRIGHLEQRPRLFPHLDLVENIAFGPRSRGMERRRARELARDWLERIGLSDRAADRPGQLSGGQQQRVALARALAWAPDLVLLDEPFAALDVSGVVQVRELVRSELKRLGVPALIVTHDTGDLLVLADRMIVIEAGEIAQQGTVAEVLGAPASGFAADLAGRILLEGTGDDDGVVLDAGLPLTRLSLAAGERMPEGPVTLSIDPAGVRVRRPADDHSPQAGANRWVSAVGAIEGMPSGLRLRPADWPVLAAEVPLAEALELGVRTDDELSFEIDPAAIRLSGG